MHELDQNLLWGQVDLVFGDTIIVSTVGFHQAVKFVDRADIKTCGVCLKVCKDKYARVKHENTVHTHGCHPWVWLTQGIG